MRRLRAKRTARVVDTRILDGVTVAVEPFFVASDNHLADVTRCAERVTHETVSDNSYNLVSISLNVQFVRVYVGSN